MKARGLLLVLVAVAKSQDIDPKSGPISGPNVVCGRYTAKTVLVGSSTVASFSTPKGTRRCTVLYKPTDCSQMKLTCTRFFVDNRDSFKCKRGDTFNVKSSNTRPETYCKRNKPTERFPVLSDGNLKVWYKANGGKRYPRKGVKCSVVCNKA